MHRFPVGFRAVRFARFFGHNLFGFHFPDTLVDTFDCLKLVHGLNVQNDFRVRNVIKVCAPSVFYAQRIIRYGEHRRLRSVHRVRVRLKFHFFRFHPSEKVAVRDFLYLPFVKVTGEAVFQEYCRFPFSEKFGIQTAFVYLACHVYRRVFKIEFVLAVHHYVVIRKILLADVIHLVDTVDALL